MTGKRTPWAGWLAAAFDVGVVPRAFWRLSLREWRALITRGDQPFDRAAFQALEAQFPDR